MFFLRMIFRSFSRQFKRRLLIAVTVCLSATVSVAMLGVTVGVILCVAGAKKFAR